MSTVTSILIDAWRKILIDQVSWVLFKNGTCVTLATPDQDLVQQATELMKEWGPVQAGTPAGDFSVIELENNLGWVVTCHHPDILDYVSPQEVEAEASEVAIGVFGRSKRHQDAQELEVIHVEDKRDPS